MRQPCDHGNNNRITVEYCVTLHKFSKKTCHKLAQYGNSMILALVFYFVVLATHWKLLHFCTKEIYTSFPYIFLQKQNYGICHLCLDKKFFSSLLSVFLFIFNILWHFLLNINRLLSCSRAGSFFSLCCFHCSCYSSGCFAGDVAGNLSTCFQFYFWNSFEKCKSCGAGKK